jgi:Ca2+-binding EF-hand superfamily protein
VSVHVRKIGNDEHIQKAFAYFDRNKSGYIEIEELREALADELDGSDEDIIGGIIRDVDTDKVSKIYLPRQKKKRFSLYNTCVGKTLVYFVLRNAKQQTRIIDCGSLALL